MFAIINSVLETGRKTFVKKNATVGRVTKGMMKPSATNPNSQDGKAPKYRSASVVKAIAGNMIASQGPNTVSTMTAVTPRSVEERNSTETKRIQQ